MNSTHPRPTIEQIWNWKANVAGGKAKINECITKAQTWMNGQIKCALKQFTSSAIPNYPSETYNGITFGGATNNPSMLEACAIKLFNGASRPAENTCPYITNDYNEERFSDHFCAWNSGEKKWELTPLNSGANPYDGQGFYDGPNSIQPFNYVERICQEANKK